MIENARMIAEKTAPEPEPRAITQSCMGGIEHRLKASGSDPGPCNIVFSVHMTEVHCVGRGIDLHSHCQ